MADFCKKCSIEMFGKDFKELANITTEKQTKNKIYAKVICEGCGWVLVNHLGEVVLKVEREK